MASKPTWKIALVPGRVCAKYHPDGKLFFASNPSTNSWKAITIGQNPEDFDAHEDVVNGISVSHDGKRVATYSADGTVLLWNWPEPQAKGDLLTRFDSPVMCADFSACDNLLACGAQDGTVKIINVTDSNQIRKLSAHEGQIKGIAFDPTRQFLATAGADGVVNIFDYTNGNKKVASINAATPAPLSDKVSFEMDWHPTGASLAIPSLSGIILVTKPETDSGEWKIASKLDEYKQESFVAKWSPNGRYLASAHGDSHFLVWDATTKLSIDRVKCPELPLVLQWNRSMNALLVCLANGRYAEFSGIISKSLPDPLKAYDAASLAAQEYESQKQSLDNMFADEEPVSKAAEPKSASGPKPAAPSTSTTSSTTNKAVSTAPKKRAEPNPDDELTMHFTSKPRSYPDDASDRYDSHMAVDGMHDDADYGADREGGSHGEMQVPFMPSATQAGGSRRIMVWNHIGSIVARVEEFPTVQTSMELDFSDISRFKPFSLTQPLAIDLATLGEQGVFTSSRQLRGTGSKKVVTNLQFTMFNKMGAKADWAMFLDSGECAVGLAIGDRWSAVATTQKRLRLFGEAGSRLAVLSLPGAPISVCAHGPLLGVLFHSGLPVPNSSAVPKSFSEAIEPTGLAKPTSYTNHYDILGDSNNSSSDTHTQSIGWWVFHVGQRRLLSSGALLPLSPGASVTWFGFSTDGALCTFDSKSILRQLAATRRYTYGSTPLVLSDPAHMMMSLEPSWSDMWFEVLDASGQASDNEVIWPIAVTNEKLRFVKHSRRSDGPTVHPKPVPQYLPLLMPFESTSSNTDTQQPDSKENAWIRGTIAMNATIGDVLEAKMALDAELDEEEEEDAPKVVLLDLAANKEVRAAQAKLDGLVLQLIREDCQDGRVERAFGLAKTLVLKKSLTVAAQVASRTSNVQLSDMISEWAEKRNIVRKRVDDASKQMVSPPVHVASDGIASLETPAMSLPQSFDNEWSSDTSKRNTAGVKRTKPDLPSKAAVSQPQKESKSVFSTREGSDDEFEIEEDEEDDGVPAPKRFTTQAIDDDDNEDIGDKEGEDVDSEHEMDIDTKPRGKDTSVFKSSPFAIAPPFQSGSGKLADTLSSIGKAKKSAAPSKGSKATAASSKPKTTSASKKK